jgi:hypothetical protein
MPYGPGRPDAARRLISITGLLGAALFGAYFGVPAFVSPLGAVLYATHPSTTQLIAVGARYEQLVTVGVWLQATGSTFSVLFFLGLVSWSRSRGSLRGQIVALGSAALVALVLAEGLFTLTWATASAAGESVSARVAFDLMSRFVQLFPVVPAPAVYLPLGSILLRSRVLPRWLAITALALGGAFLAVGVAEIFLPVAQAIAAGLAAVQAIWIVAAALALLRGPAQPAGRVDRTSGSPWPGRTPSDSPSASE